MSPCPDGVVLILNFQEPGTICITKKGFTELLQPYFPVPSCGKVIETPTDANEIFNQKLIDLCKKFETPYKVGNTVATNCFYEGQGFYTY